MAKHCAGCSRELEVGDHYIEDTASGYIGEKSDPVVDGLIADIFGGDGSLGGGAGGKVIFCADCTTTGGERYLFSTYYGDDATNPKEDE